MIGMLSQRAVMAQKSTEGTDHSGGIRWNNGQKNTDLLNYMKMHDGKADQLEKEREERDDKRAAMILDIFKQMLGKNVKSVHTLTNHNC
jgi:hypothetical protein